MPRYGSSGGDFEDAIRRAQAAGQAAEELQRKEEQRQQTEERGAATEAGSTRARGSVTDATERLSAALSENISRLTTETTAVEANTAAWRANAVARQEVASSGIATGRVSAARGPAVAPAIVEDPGAYARRDDALRAQAAAETQQRSSRAAYVGSTRPSSTATSEQQAGLLAASEEAKQQVAAARQETAAAQRNVKAQEALAAQREASVAESARVNTLQAQEAILQEQINRSLAAQAVEQAARAVSSPAQRQIAAGAVPIGIPQRTGQTAAEAQALSSRVDRAYQAVSVPGQLQLPQYASGGRTPIAAGPIGSTTVGGYNAAGGITSGEEYAAAGQAQKLEALAVRQREVNQAYNESVASYANSSQALTRHGALTTEFISAFARGQVTLREFGDQITATIGKFSGWAVAAALVYGAVGALKDLGSGAAQTQTGVVQLGRFIPGLGGPAGGGTGQVSAAESTLRGISTQFNVPIKEVVDSMQIMARVFHNVSDAGDATRAVLAAVKLDQIPQAQATQYLTGIAQSLNLTEPRNGQSPGRQVEGVVSSLNALQNVYGARVAQTLPALARAAPAAQAGGLDTATLEALVAIGVRSGITGPQVGTALLRSIGTFAFRPASQGTFSQYGITAQQGQYGDLIKQVTSVIDTRQKDGTLTGKDLNNLAQALGGPLLGTRTILPILEQERLHPGAISGARDLAANPPSFQKDLDAVLSTLSERFKSLGIALQNLGSFLASSGVLSPILAGFDVIGTLVHTIEALISPFVGLLSIVNQLPGPLRDMLGALVAFRVARSVYNSQFGSNLQGAAGRLPSLSQLDTEPRQVIRNTLGTLQTYSEPRAATALDRADGALVDARARQVAAVDNLTKYETENAAASIAPAGSKAYQDYSAGREQLAAEARNADAKALAVSDRAVAAGERVAQVAADIAILKDRQLSTDQKSAYIAERGLAIDTEIVDLQAQRLTEMRALVQTLGKTSAAESLGLRASGAAAEAQAVGVAATGPTRREAALASAAAAAAGGAASGRVFLQGPGVGLPGYSAGTLSYPTSISAPPPGYITAASQAAAAGAAVGEGGLLSRAGLVANAALYRAQALPGQIQEGATSISGGQAAFAGLIGSQLVGSTIGGSVGNAITNTGGTVATGAILASLLNKSPLAGAALGFGASDFQQATQGNPLPLALGGAGAAIGGALGLVTTGPFAELGVPAGAAIGGLIGSTLGTVGGLLGIGGGSGPSTADQQRQADQAALKANQNTSNITKFGDQFANDLSSAFTGTGDAATKAQAKIEAQVRDLAATLKAFGFSSTSGQLAVAQLNQTIAAAASSTSLSPDKAGRIIETASSAIQTGIESQFKYQIATGDPSAALAGASAGYAQQQQGFAQAQADGVTGLQSANGILTQALKKGGAALIANARAGVVAATQGLQQLKDLATQSAQGATLAQQADAASVYSIGQTRIGATTALTQSQAGGNKLTGIKDQISQQQQLQNLTSTPNLNPNTAYADYTNAQAKINDLQNQAVQQQVTELKSKQSVSAAAIPSYDTVGAAQKNLLDLTQQYDYIKQHAIAFDPSQINDALAAVIKAQVAAAQAVADYKTQMTDLQGQITSASEAGDKVAQSVTDIQTATADLALARSPQQQASAQLKIINAQNALHQAQQARITAQAGLTRSQDPNDAVGNAQIEIAAAQQTLANAKGIDEQIAAQTQLNGAETAYRSAIAARVTAQAALKASETVDPLQKLRDQIAAAATNLAAAKGPDAKVAAATNLNGLKQQYESTLVSQRQSTIDFQYSMQQITTQQAINQLEDLLKLKDLTLANRQQLEQKIRTLQQGGSTIGQFDLAPGNIKLPTVLDVQRAIKQAQAQAGGPPSANPPQHALQSIASSHVGTLDARTYISVMVAKGSDASAVIDAIDRSTGSRLKARLRAAGVRGT